MHELQGGTHYTQQGEGVRDTMGERLTDTVEVMVTDTVAITNVSSEGVREKWIFPELGAHVYTGGPELYRKDRNKGGTC